MFGNYIKTAVRNLLRYRQYTLINVLGLAVGFAACMLMLLYVMQELSYDTHWKQADRLVELHSRFSYSPDRVDEFAGAAGPFKPALVSYFPEEIKRATRLYGLYPNVFIGDRVMDQKVVWTDRDTLDMFDFDVIKGDMARMFADSRSLGLSERVAEKLFGSTDIIDRTLTLEMGRTRETFKVAAVYKNLPQATTVKLPAVALFDEKAPFPGYSSNWWNIQAKTYFEMKKGVSPSLLKGRFGAFVDATVPHGFFTDVKKPSDLLSLSAVPLKDVRLYGLNGTAGTVALVAAIAALVLVIASINFVNLTTAKGAQRAREVALRKTLGASRRDLIIQFLGESILMAFFALLIGLFFTELALPAFSSFVGKDLILDYTDPEAVSLVFALVCTVGLAGGFYPAYVLSGYRPSATLKANQTAEPEGSRRLRGALVVVQFAIAIVLIVSASLVYIQRDYAINLDPGFNQKKLLTVQYLFRGDTASNRHVLKTQALALPNVTAATFSEYTPPNGAGNPVSLMPAGSTSTVSVPWQQVDADFFSVYQIPLVAGRSFRPGYIASLAARQKSLTPGADLQLEAILSESAVHALGYASAQAAIGQTVRSDDMRRPTVLTIVGVAGDTRFNSSRSASPPQIYTPTASASSLTLRYTGHADQAIAELRGMWQRLYPEVPLYYYAVDDAMRHAFDDDIKASILLTLFSGLAILVACLGLYGLASFSTQRRTREVGVRKVLGARVRDIVRLFLWQFARPVLWANLIAWPVSFWVTQAWLERFPYRIDAWILLPLCLGAGALTLMVAWLTVGGNAARVARQNPIKTLRYE